MKCVAYSGPAIIKARYSRDHGLWSRALYLTHARDHGCLATLAVIRAREHGCLSTLPVNMGREQWPCRRHHGWRFLTLVDTGREQWPCTRHHKRRFLTLVNTGRDHGLQKASPVITARERGTSKVYIELGSGKRCSAKFALCHHKK